MLNLIKFYILNHPFLNTINILTLQNVASSKLLDIINETRRIDFAAVYVTSISDFARDAENLRHSGIRGCGRLAL